MASYQTCTEITAECPVSATTYGYFPVLWANALFCAIFGLCTVIQLGLGTWYKTWTWMATVSLGCGMEFAGYLARSFMHTNPWNSPAYKTQLIVIVLAPSFLAAGINLTLKHVVLALSTEYSRLKPTQYTWIFIPIDFSCICLQAVGGGLAASAGETGSRKVLSAGNNIIVTGIVMQVVNLVAFGAVAAEYAWRLRKHRDVLGSKLDAAKGGKFRAFIAAVTIAFVAVLIRTIYRIPEMAFGWGSKNQRNEVEFMVFEGFMIVICAVALSVVHPGWSFPALASTFKGRAARKSEREAAPSPESKE